MLFFFLLQLQVAALSALETEVVELSERLKISEQQRDLIQKKLNEAVDDKERTQRRLDSIGAAHESRITEMHCVIVELNKKLKFQQENAILEDQEPDGSRSGMCNYFYLNKSKWEFFYPIENPKIS